MFGVQDDCLRFPDGQNQIAGDPIECLRFLAIEVKLLAIEMSVCDFW